ncbi:hypothetical protein Trydic_g18913 [Trypoxylus dichotomus]
MRERIEKSDPPVSEDKKKDERIYINEMSYHLVSCESLHPASIKPSVSVTNLVVEGNLLRSTVLSDVTVLTSSSHGGALD